MEIMISLLWLLVKLAIIWGIWWIAEVVIPLMKMFPEAMRVLLRRVIMVIAIIATLVVIIQWIAGAAGSIPGF